MASEIRKLATGTQNSANEIDELMETIQSVTHSSNNLLKQTEESLIVFNQIAQSKQMTVNNISIISNSSVEQHKTVESLNKVIASLNKVTSDMYTLIKRLT